MSNSLDPDEMAHYEQSHLDPGCLQKLIVIACGSERLILSGRQQHCQDCFCLSSVKRVHSKMDLFLEEGWGWCLV